jgi:broad specificity phosphatase PhoE
MPRSTILIRHGEIVESMEDPPLSQVGREQIEEIVRQIGGIVPSEIIVSSPSRRTRQSTEIISGGLDINHIFYYEMLRDYNAQEESFWDMVERSRAAFRLIKRLAPNGCIVVTHGGIIQGIVSEIFDVDPSTIDCPRGRGFAITVSNNKVDRRPIGSITKIAGVGR